ncbi:MAG: hypothetical protein ACREQA_19765 [Candidatus Binatia bacterium]
MNSLEQAAVFVGIVVNIFMLIAFSVGGYLAVKKWVVEVARQVRPSNGKTMATMTEEIHSSLTDTVNDNTTRIGVLEFKTDGLKVWRDEHVRRHP